MVCAMIIAGFWHASAHERASRICVKLCPSISRVSHQNVRYLSARFPSGITMSVVPSIWIPLQSMMTIRLLSWNLLADMIASHVCPSWCSPSDIQQITLFFLWSILSESATPTAWESQCPRGQEEFSTPGIPSRGCHCNNACILRSFPSSSCQKNHFRANAAYQIGQICPLERRQ